MIKIETEHRTLLVNPNKIASIFIWEGSNHMNDKVYYRLTLNYGGHEDSMDVLNFETESDRDQALNKLVIN